jgi:hypothetical protein
VTGPTAAEIRAAFPGVDFVLADGGYWEARLPGGDRVVAGTLGLLAEALNNLIGGTGQEEIR